MCIVFATKQNVNSVFQMKAATITKNSDRKREKLKLYEIWGPNCAPVFQRKKFPLDFERDTFASISDKFIKSATYWSFNPDSLHGKFVLKLYNLIELRFGLLISEILTVPKSKSKESCGSI